MLNDKKLTVIDLFSGCGGLSKGFENEGYEILLGIDNWKDSLDTFELNHKGAKTLLANIHNLKGKDILKIVDKEIDIIIGGPPCQGFSMAGKREFEDERNSLVFEFIRLVKEINPSFFLMENVLGLLSMGNGRVKEDILQRFRDIGYSVEVKPIWSHHYGVPQKRRRVVFLGNRIGAPVVFPNATHMEKEKQDLPNNYLNPITVGEAISDLPLLDDDPGEETIDYPKSPRSEYQKKMRKDSKKLYNHTASSHTEQTKKVIALVPEGGNWKDLPKEFQNIRSYANTWRRLNSKFPSVTIDTGHRHHFHYKANRVPTVRESARIQSFPDDFIFCGPRTSQFKQVGNAVPPLMAQAFAKVIKQTIMKSLERKKYDSKDAKSKLYLPN